MKRFAAMILPLALSACFVGDAPLIEAGEGIVFSDAVMEFCADGECHAGALVDDAYVIEEQEKPPGEETSSLRFAPLWGDQAGVRVYVAEMETSKDEGVLYFVARRTPENPSRIDLQMPDCKRYDAQARAQFDLTAVDTYGCSAPDLETLKAALLSVYSGDFSRPGFWTE